MKKIIIAFLLITGIFIFVQSCKHTPPDPVPPTGGGGGGGTGSTSVCFESEILPLFQSNCAKSGCHDAGTAAKGYVFDNYQNIVKKDIIAGNAVNSKVYEVLFENGKDQMPPPPNADLTAAQKALIGRWINEGAANTTNCASNCNVTQFKYAANISLIISSYCLGCHSGAAPSGNINLTTHAGVAAVAGSGRLYGAVTHTSGYSAMPKNTNKLSDCQITQIANWINAGALNN